jgi:hypothetical protein
VYEGQFDPSEPDKRLGFRELIENLQWAQDNCGGRFRVIVAKAKDTNSHPRSIQECFPHERIVMRLEHFDVGTGNFIAQVDGA